MAFTDADTQVSKPRWTGEIADWTSYSAASGWTMTNTDLIVCEVPDCSHEFRYVPAREFPGLCLDHAEEASRERHGWTPANSRD